MRRRIVCRACSKNREDSPQSLRSRLCGAKHVQAANSGRAEVWGTMDVQVKIECSPYVVRYAGL